MDIKTTAQADPQMGRFLRRFTLSNVRTYRKQSSIDFCHSDGRLAQWTVILGENGTGKTTLLQYIAGTMFVRDESMLNAVGGKKSGIPPFRPRLGSPKWLGWHSQNLSAPITLPTELLIRLEASAPSAALVSAQADNTLKRPLEVKFVFGVNSEGKPQITTAYTVPGVHEYFRQFHLFGYGASRHVAGPASPYLSSDAFARQGNTAAFGTLINDDYPLISPEQWLLGLDHISHSGGKAADEAKRALESARRCLASVLPDIEDISVGPYSMFNGKTSMALLCKTPYANVPVPFSSLGIGYRAMAAWVTDFLRRMYELYPMLDHPNTGPAIVLIDEFDLHMHPRWQQNAMQALSKEFPNTQFIVTVHSPLVVQATEGNAKLVVLRRVKNKEGLDEILIDSNPRYAAGWRVDQILASDLYDLTPRSAKYTDLIEQRVRLLQQVSLSADDREKLKQLDEQLDREAPPGISSASKQLFAELQVALKRIEKAEEVK